MSSKKTVIYRDLTAHKAANDKQVRMQACIDIVLKEFSKAGIEPKDIREVVKSDDPVTYARELYWQENRKYFPPGVDATTAINGTAYDEKVVKAAWDEYKQLGKTAKPLIIREDSVELTVKEEEYDWFLDEEKKELHTALDKFIKASEALNEHIDVNVWSLKRAIIGDGIMVINGKLTINPYQFKA